jgi:hypothetical protein
MEDSRETTKDGPESMDGDPEIEEDGSVTIGAGLVIMEEGQGITDTTTQTRSPTCC